MDEYIFKISQNSANGIIYKSVYKYNNEEEKRKFFVAIKCSMKKNADNNYYEYTIGKCINKIKEYFPNFIYTFNYNFIYKSLLKKYYNKSTIFFDRSTENNDLIDADKCDLNDTAATIIEFIPNIISLDKIIATLNSKELELELYNILFQLYMALHSLKNDFTHNDLHIDNVQFSKVPNNKKIVLTYYYDNKEYKIVTSYIPIIIDYGRAYIKCENFGSDIETKKIETKEFIKEMCNISNCNHLIEDDKCNLKNIGMFYVGTKNGRTNEYKPNVTKKNVSQDLRYIYMLFSHIEKNRTLDTKFVKEFLYYRNRNYFVGNGDDYYFVKNENTDHFNDSSIFSFFTKSISTLTDCVNFLISYYSSFYESFAESDENIYGYMNIFCDSLVKWSFVSKEGYINKIGNNYELFMKSSQDYNRIKEQKQKEKKYEEALYDGPDPLAQKYLKYKYKYMKLKKLKKLYK